MGDDGAGGVEVFADVPVSIECRVIGRAACVGDAEQTADASCSLHAVAKVHAPGVFGDEAEGLEIGGRVFGDGVPSVVEVDDVGVARNGVADAAGLAVVGVFGNR